MNTIKPRICPLCGRTFSEPPALSRTDNKTYICPDCGTRQALASLGCGTGEQEHIVQTIHNAQNHRS